MREFRKTVRRCIALILWAFCPIALSNCLPSGLPEYFSETHEASTAFQSERGGLSARMAAADTAARANKRILLVLSAETLRNEFLDPPGLGHQYLLGFIPFTAVYFQHGPQRFLLEILLDELGKKEFSSFAVDEQYEGLARHLIGPHLVIRSTLDHPSLSGFDAFFFRVLGVGGEIVLDEYPTGEDPFSKPIRTTRLPLDRTKFRKFAYGPTLRYEFESALRESVEKLLSNISPLGRRTVQMPARENLSTAVDNASSSLLVVSLPVGAGAIQADARSLISRSYGFSSLPLYSESATLRLIQHGMYSAAAAADMPAAMSNVSQITSSFLPRDRQGYWNLRTTVRALEKIETSEGRLRLKLEMALVEVREFDELLLKKMDCQIDFHETPDTDGAWVVAVEQASGALLDVFFGVRSDIPGVSCGD